jgi:hypothetical protein
VQRLVPVENNGHFDSKVVESTGVWEFTLSIYHLLMGPNQTDFG